MGEVVPLHKHWEVKADLEPFFSLYEKGIITATTFAKTISAGLSELAAPIADSEFTRIMDCLEKSNEDEIDDVLEWLYDWADQDHRLYLHTKGD